MKETDSEVFLIETQQEIIQNNTAQELQTDCKCGL